MREAAGGLLAHCDRPGSCNGLQSRCDVGRVAERDGLVIHGAHDADRGRAGVDADADVEALDPPRLLDLARVLPHDVHDPQRRAGGSLGVVFVSGRNAEVRADAVAHVRLHRPAVLVHGTAHLVHAFADQRLRLLRRQLLGQCGRSDDVGEEHRHGANLVVTRHAQRPRVRQVRNDPSRPCMRSSLDGPFRMRHAGAGRRRLAAPSGQREHERGYAHRRGAGRVPGRVPARPRRHERRLSRRAREPRPQGRPQGAGVAAGARPELPRAVHARVAARGRARPPERHPDLRRRRGRRRRRRRSALHRDAVRRRARPALAPSAGGAPGRRAHALHARAGRERTRRRPRQRPDPPRRQALEHPDRRALRARVPDGLRRREADERARPHADGDLRRHHRVRRARADRGADARPSHGRLRARLRALRVPRRPAAVRAGRRGRGDARPPDEPAAEADGGAPGSAQGARPGRRARDGEVAGRALRDRA